jgi:outer membrane protein assembly factor BamB
MDLDPDERDIECERIHCLDEQTGATLWTHKYRSPYDGISYTAGPRASVTVDSDQAFALGATGHLHCLDAATGKILWKSDLQKRFNIRRLPVWGIAAAPLVFQDVVILHLGAPDGACAVALDRDNGDERWRALDDRASYSAPILIEQAGQPVVVLWNGDSIAGLSPTDGKVHWRIAFPPKRMPIGVATPVVENGRVYVSSFYDGSFMVQLNETRTAADRLWAQRGRSERHTEALHCMISTPLMIDGYVYGVDSYGELRCLNALNGERIWEDLHATPPARWSNIHMVRQQDRVWMFNERGELIIATVSPKGFQEISRAKLIEPTTAQLNQRQGVCWSHPAFANKHVFARNDAQLVCADLSRR